MDIHNETAIVEHEATTSKISEDQIFYCNQRGISTEDAVGLIVNGYAKEVLNKLPMEFAVEAPKLRLTRIIRLLYKLHTTMFYHGFCQDSHLVIRVR